MQSQSTANFQNLLSLFQVLSVEEKEIFYLQIAEQRAIPEWQKELVRQRKKESDGVSECWVTEADFIKSLG
jgi:hypothetical protein